VPVIAFFVSILFISCEKVVFSEPETRMLVPADTAKVDTVDVNLEGSGWAGEVVISFDF